ncbi:MAG: 4Fe-4S ferredoxin [Candidatus Anammoximicrobium sp.]|mgnify:CR=1 FL=1|nr:4Fe-4S ferredoxin [Candidatus Anammoximicrobium sp.]
MSRTVDPEFHRELAAFGASDIMQCVNCGNCTAVCALSQGDTVFPRKTIRYVQLGLKDKLLESPEPWLCYYCGECTETCPRQADPGEIMMGVRRWLTAHYDRSGLGRRLYTSPQRLWLSILARGMIPLVLLAVFHLWTGFRWIVTERVELNRFAPVMWVWAAVLIHFVFLGYRVMSGAWTMSRFVLGAGASPTTIPLAAYLAEWKTLLLHFFTQKRWRDCGPRHVGQWVQHLVLVSGYLTMLVLIVGLLGWFQTDAIYPLYHPQRWLGYVATLALIYGSVAMLVGRFRKREPVHKHSQLSDWLFPGFILTGAVTGILVHVFRYAGWPWPTYGMYLVHVMAMVAMLDVEVGIGKWMHLIYRPLAMYLAAVKRRAASMGTPAAAEAGQPASG